MTNSTVCSSTQEIRVSQMLAKLITEGVELPKSENQFSEASKAKNWNTKLNHLLYLRIDVPSSSTRGKRKAKRKEALKSLFQKLKKV